MNTFDVIRFLAVTAPIWLVIGTMFVIIEQARFGYSNDRPWSMFMWMATGSEKYITPFAYKGGKSND